MFFIEFGDLLVSVCFFEMDRGIFPQQYYFIISFSLCQYIFCKPFFQNGEKSAFLKFMFNLHKMKGLFSLPLRQSKQKITLA